ncbi:MAG: MBL fold metallo-hydrolase [Victivallaceae bacterium]|nr:MBL fold metallo-hydrolase [Victivallaceae bacterium]
MKTKNKKILKVILAVVGGLLLIVGVICVELWHEMGETPSAAAAAEFEGLPNYADGRFHNTEQMDQSTPPPEGGTAVGKRPKIWRMIFAGNSPEKEIPTVKLSASDFSAAPNKDAAAVRWFGHSSLLFELNGARFMVDPVFGNAAPIPFAVRRYVDPPLVRRDLPKLDFVIITHDHYDHLEYQTIAMLRGSETEFICPLGVGARLRGWLIKPEKIHELNWGESLVVNGVMVAAREARHFSGRTFEDRNRTLWASFIVAGGGKKLFISGDGGYGGHFSKIGEADGPFDYVFMEIDAWNGNWRNNHIFPDDAVRAVRELRGAKMVPVHWSVFNLADHPWDESIGMVAAAADREGVELVTPVIGAKLDLNIPESERWWLDR